MASLKLIVLGCCFLAACQASAPVINTHFASAVPGEFIVVLKPGSVGLSASTPQVTILNSFHINDFRALHVKVDDVQLAALREDTNVKVIEAETHEFHADCNSQTSGATIWGLSRTSSRPLPEFTGATYDWTDEDDGSGVNAYVIDTGIYLGHQDYAGRVSHGFTAPGISEGDDDLNGHGTHCAGTVGGTTYGVAKGVNLIAVKVLNRAGSGSTTDVFLAIIRSAKHSHYKTQLRESNNNTKQTWNVINSLIQRTQNKKEITTIIDNNTEFTNPRRDLGVFVEGKIESLFIEMKVKRKSLIVGEIYRFPKVATGKDSIFGTGHMTSWLLIPFLIHTPLPTYIYVLIFTND
ncbi:hypothetical protein CAPTEDRAFT_217313 [Capitella teleta]|uniref:Peptidase S8/S53 domain-containing protein n=1 Tax=Capitella teleta TaxID=283909 RepID=R7TYT5_CAPTE|nr:hypothetical protein CAPTEDRAFT_217313 [Capitella teleta]|eukprot:ELT99088.1 hypothetical protein CAPTEDRAFT_217313 [Capitella teleta]